MLGGRAPDDTVCAQVLLVAGDTFRAAAAEQLAGWAERSNAQMAAANSQKQRPDALMYSAIDRVSLATNHIKKLDDTADLVT